MRDFHYSDIDRSLALSQARGFDQFASDELLHAGSDAYPGAFADIIFVDYYPNTPMTVENLPWHILFGFENSMVTGAICAGKVLMKDRRLLFLDEAEITARSCELAKKVWERFDS